MADDTLAPNPKVRRTGAVILVLVLLCYVGAGTGFDAHGTVGRIVLLIVGTLLLPIGLALIRTRTPAITALQANRFGMTFVVGHGRAESIPWTDIEAVWLRRLGVVYSGYLLGLQYADQAPRLAALRSFERPVAEHGARVVIGLNARQATAMRADLPGAAGPRYRDSAP
jgi:hypothetical protein